MPPHTGQANCFAAAVHPLDAELKAYRRKVFGDRFAWNVQLNVKNIGRATSSSR